MTTGIDRARALLGLTNHGHHSHGHHPYPSHDRSPYSHYPAGTGPFRPGPGAPTFGAVRMPDSHRPGVVFGPAHNPLHANHAGHDYGWGEREPVVASFGVRGPQIVPDTHQSTGHYGPGHGSHRDHGYGWRGRFPGAPDVGSTQRWHSVIHPFHPTQIAGQHLSAAQIDDLRKMMIAALNAGAVKAAVPTAPHATWATRTPPKLSTVLAHPMTSAWRASLVQSDARKASETAKANVEQASSDALARYLAYRKAMTQAGPGAQITPGGITDTSSTTWDTPGVSFDASASLKL